MTGCLYGTPAGLTDVTTAVELLRIHDTQVHETTRLRERAELFNIVLAGISDHDMRQKALAQTALGNAEEASMREANPGVHAVRSQYQRSKRPPLYLKIRTYNRNVLIVGKKSMEIIPTPRE